MTRTQNVLRHTGFAWMVLVGFLGGAFVVGETFDDPGGWAAVLMVSAWLVPLVVLAVLALARPEPAERVFVVATTVVAVFTLADSAFGIVPRDDWGPVAAIVVFGLGVALGFLGVRRPALAGTLLVTVALAQFLATLLLGVGGEGGGGGGSSGIVVLPLLVGGVLFLLAGRHPSGAAGHGWSRRGPHHATPAGHAHG